MGGVSIPGKETGLQLKEIPSIPGYWASDDGKIFIKPGEAWLEVNQSWPKKGYKQVRVPIDGEKRCRQVHRLVLEAFRGPCPAGMQGRHLNDIRGDNRLENLKWGTPKENGEDKVINGVQPWGEEHHKAIWSEAQVLEMRRLWNSGWSLDQLQDKFGGLRPAIHHAVSGRTWTHLVSDDPSAQPSTKPKLLLTAFGLTLRYSEWAKHEKCMVSAHALRARIKKGIPPEKAITDPPDDPVEAFGERKILKEWSQDPRCVVTYNTLLRRLRKGVPIDEAIASEWCNTAAKRKPPNLKPDQVADIRRRVASGEALTEIARLHGVTKGAIWRIKHGKSHRMN